MTPGKKITLVLFLACVGLLVAGGLRSTETKSTTEHRALPSPTISLSFTPTSSTRAQDEYVRIQTSPKTKTSYFITGWELKSARGQASVRLGKASNLPTQGTINTQQAILAPEGSTLVISSGRSPIGVSFRVNACSGFFSQRQEFVPALSQDCPSAEDILLPEEESYLEPGCKAFIASLPKCTDPTTDPVLKTLSQPCQDLLVTKINYNSCVARLSTTNNFYKNEWRLYLGQDMPIWHNAIDALWLLDQNGVLLNIFSY